MSRAAILYLCAAWLCHTDDQDSTGRTDLSKAKATIVLLSPLPLTSMFRLPKYSSKTAKLTEPPFISTLCTSCPRSHAPVIIPLREFDLVFLLALWALGSVFFVVGVDTSRLHAFLLLAPFVSSHCAEDEHDVVSEGDVIVFALRIPCDFWLWLNVFRVGWFCRSTKGSGK